MKFKRKKHHPEHPSVGFSNLSANTEFYSGNPTERPLSDTRGASDSRHTRDTERQQAVSRRKREKMDPREKMALLAILRAGIMILALVIAFFLLRKGIGIYEESIWLKHTGSPEKSPVLQEVALVEDFNIQNRDSREQFAKRIELWKEADRLVRSADVLLQRNIYDEAIKQCQEALRRDQFHRGALERLGRLYYAKGDYVEAVNAYIRLLSVDPTQEKTQKRLIEALDAYGDYGAVKYMAEWYLDQHTFNADIQLYLSNALYAQESFEAAAEAYDRVLRESPMDAQVMERQADAYMQVQQYEKALVPLAKLRENDYRNPAYYKQIAACNAQLQKTQETVQTLGRAAQLFGQQVAMGLIQDPLLDPVREDRAFQAFADRIGGKEFRLGVEDLMKNEAREKHLKDIEPQLKMPPSESLDAELLKPGRQ